MKNKILLSFFKKIFEKNVRMAQRKQFSQPRRQSFDKTPKHSTPVLKKNIIPFFAKKNIFRKYVLLDTLIAVVTIPPKSFRQKAKTFLFNLQKRLRELEFISETILFSWNFSYGHVECSYANHAEKISAKTKNSSIDVR